MRKKQLKPPSTGWQLQEPTYAGKTRLCGNRGCLWNGFFKETAFCDCCMIIREVFQSNFQGNLYSNAQDKQLFSSLISSLKRNQQQLQRGRVVLQHLQRLLLAVASDDVGWTVMQQLLLPVIRQRIDAAAAAQAVQLAAAAEASLQLQQLWEQPENAAALQKAVLVKQKHATSLRRSCELLCDLRTALQPLSNCQLWSESNHEGLCLVAALGIWMQMHSREVAAGLLLLEPHAGKPEAGDGSSSSSSTLQSIGGSSEAGTGTCSSSSTLQATGSSGAAGAGTGSSSSSSAAQATGSSSAVGAGTESSSSSSTAAQTAAVDELVATAWGLCAEVLLLVAESEQEQEKRPNKPAVAVLVEAGGWAAVQGNIAVAFSVLLALVVVSMLWFAATNLGVFIA
jgi:hypothetical protein